MRWTVPLLLLVAWSAGCLDEVKGVAAVVLVESSYEVTGEGRPSHVFVLHCDMARYTRDPPEVTLHGLAQEGARPAFVLLHDLGDARRAVDPDAPPGPRVFASVASAGRPFWRLGGSSVAVLGFGSAFPLADLGARTVAWDGGSATFDGQTLRLGKPVVRTYGFDVPAEEGGSLRVEETLRVTYLGKVPTAVEGRVCS